MQALKLKMNLRVKKLARRFFRYQNSTQIANRTKL